MLGFGLKFPFLLAPETPKRDLSFLKYSFSLRWFVVFETKHSICLVREQESVSSAEISWDGVARRLLLRLDWSPRSATGRVSWASAARCLPPLQLAAESVKDLLWNASDWDLGFYECWIWQFLFFRKDWLCQTFHRSENFFTLQICPSLTKWKSWMRLKILKERKERASQTVILDWALAFSRQFPVIT